MVRLISPITSEQSKKKRVPVVVGVIFDSKKRVLLALRPHAKHQGGFWEFPGGKIELNETPWEALRRELHEEIGIEVKTAVPLVQCLYDYQEYDVFLDAWRILDFNGEPSGCEGQPIFWATMEELKSLPMLSANHPIVQAIWNLSF